MEIDLGGPWEKTPDATDTPEAKEGGGLANLDNTYNISNHYFPSLRRLETNFSAPRRQHDINP